MWGAVSDERTGLSFTIAAGPRQSSHSWVRLSHSLTFKLVSVITYRHGPCRKYRSLLYCNRFRGKMFVKALLSNGCVYLLRICCLASDVVSLFVSRSLPSNGSTRYSIKLMLRNMAPKVCVCWILLVQNPMSDFYEQGNRHSASVKSMTQSI
jgi:hypothetical protein